MIEVTYTTQNADLVCVQVDDLYQARLLARALILTHSLNDPDSVRAIVVYASSGLRHAWTYSTGWETIVVRAS